MVSARPHSSFPCNTPPRNVACDRLPQQTTSTATLSKDGVHCRPFLSGGRQPRRASNRPSIFRDREVLQYSGDGSLPDRPASPGPCLYPPPIHFVYPAP